MRRGDSLSRTDSLSPMRGALSENTAKAARSEARRRRDRNESAGDCGGQGRGRLCGRAIGAPTLFGTLGRAIGAYPSGAIQAGDRIGDVAGLDVEKRRNAQNCPKITVRRGVENREDAFMNVHPLSPKSEERYHKGVHSGMLQQSACRSRRLSQPTYGGHSPAPATGRARWGTIFQHSIRDLAET